MIEKKLHAAAEALPESRNDFSAVENRMTEKARRPRPVRRRRSIATERAMTARYGLTLPPRYLPADFTTRTHVS